MALRTGMRLALKDLDNNLATTTSTATSSSTAATGSGTGTTTEAIKQQQLQQHRRKEDIESILREVELLPDSDVEDLLDIDEDSNSNSNNSNNIHMSTETTAATTKTSSEDVTNTHSLMNNSIKQGNNNNIDTNGNAAVIQMKTELEMLRQTLEKLAHTAAPQADVQQQQQQHQEEELKQLQQQQQQQLKEYEATKILLQEVEARKKALERLEKAHKKLLEENINSQTEIVLCRRKINLLQQQQQQQQQIQLHHQHHQLQTQQQLQSLTSTSSLSTNLSEYLFNNILHILSLLRHHHQQMVQFNPLQLF